LLHRFESANHCLNSRTDLFVLLQQVGALRSQDILALFQRAILVLELVAYVDERVDALLESLEFVFKR